MKFYLNIVSILLISSVSFAGSLEDNKKESQAVLKLNENKAASTKGSGDWNPETGFIIRMNEIAAEYLNLSVEITECELSKVNPKLDLFFKDKLLNEHIVVLLTDPAKQCLSTYLSNKK